MGISQLLFIEPKRAKSNEPVLDYLTELVENAFKLAKPCGPYWKGVHTCVCGEHSTNHNYLLPNGWQTNSLAVHYMKYHRSEIPKQEIQKVQKLAPRRPADGVTEVMNDECGHCGRIYCDCETKY